MAGPDFELTLHLAGGQSIHLNLEEERVKAITYPPIAVMAEAGTREAHRDAALAWVATILEPDARRAAAVEHEPPLRVVDQDLRAWLVPRANILSAMFADPTLVHGSPLGFSFPDLPDQD